jgi:hypothetical protein
MNKTYTILGIGLVVFLIILIFLSTLLFKKSSSSNRTAPGTTTDTSQTTPLPTFPPSEFSFISVSPLDGANNVPLQPTITITFNKPISRSNVDFSIAPSVDVSQNINGSTLTITPKSALSPGTLYTYIVKFPKSNTSTPTFHFTTTGPTQEFLPDTKPEGLFDQEKKNELENAPDIYVTNLLPYSTATFSAESDYIDNPPSHFRITVTLLSDNKDSAKQEFIAWLKSNNLDDSKINKLDIQYK